MPLKFYLVGRERRRADAAARSPRVERRAPGRGTQHYIGIPDRRVSRRHAEIYVLDDRVFLRDLGSKNGTYVLAQGRLQRFEEGYLRPQQLVSFGGCLRRMSRLIHDLDLAGDQGPPESRE